MELILGLVVAVGLFIGVNAHQSSTHHTRQLKKQYECVLHQKDVALARARKPKIVRTSKLDGIEVADLSGERHA